MVHLTFPIAPTERSREVQRGARAPHRGPVDRPAAGSARRRRVRRQQHRPGHRRGAAGAPARRRLHRPGARRSTRARDRSAGCRRTRRPRRRPGPVDLAVVAVPADGVPGVVADAAAAGVHGLVVVSAGLRRDRPGRRGRAAGAGARGARRRHAPGRPELPRHRQHRPRRTPQRHARPAAAGRPAGWASSASPARWAWRCSPRPTGGGLGLSSFVSAGNRADVSGNDLLQYWQDDPATDVILLYLETFGNPRKFARLARRIGAAQADRGASRSPAAGGGHRAGRRPRWRRCFAHVRRDPGRHRRRAVRRRAAAGQPAAAGRRRGSGWSATRPRWRALAATRLRGRRADASPTGTRATSGRRPAPPRSPRRWPPTAGRPRRRRARGGLRAAAAGRAGRPDADADAGTRPRPLPAALAPDKPVVATFLVRAAAGAACRRTRRWRRRCARWAA